MTGADPSEGLGPEAFARALGDEAALAALAAAWPPGPAAVAALRGRLGEASARAALTIIEARRKLARKWPERPDLVATPEAAEQMSSAAAAAHKAMRFAALAPPPARALDLCAGVGGDAIALAAALEGAVPALAFDRDPLRAWMCQRNAHVPAAALDVEGLSLRGAVVHLDPARRAGGRRLHRYEDLLPGPRFIARVLAETAAAAIKLGPGIDFAALPALARCEVEVLGERSGLTQAVLWSGGLARAPGLRTATRLGGGGRASLTGPPDLPVEVERGAGRYLLEVAPEVERAGLLGHLARTLGLPALHPALALLVADAPIAHPFLVGFEVLETLPWRERRVRAALRALGARSVEVKTRGGIADADGVQRALAAALGHGPPRPARGGSASAPAAGADALTLFILRAGAERIAILARRVHRLCGSGTLRGSQDAGSDPDPDDRPPGDDEHRVGDPP